VRCPRRPSTMMARVMMPHTARGQLTRTGSNTCLEHSPRARATAAEMEVHHARSCTGWVLGSSMPTAGASAGGAR
jgi:hypothetical protein